MSIKHDILSALTYFDIFNYPLTLTEISQFLASAQTHDDIQNALHALTAEGSVFQFDDYYTLQQNSYLIVRRREGNLRAHDMLQTAGRIAGFLSAFPFVRGVAVSGSLSKNFADENADIDYFIITAAGKLWIARSLMHIFKKWAIFRGKADLYCMNYYIDETALSIREKNLYTAIEVATLLPLRGIEAFRDFYARNRWYRGFLPNHSMRISYVKEARKGLLKSVLEFFINNPFGNLLDLLLMRITAYRWKRKTQSQKRNKRGVIMSMDSSRHFAKPDPDQFQKQLLGIFAKRIYGLKTKHQSGVKTIF